MPKVDRTKPRRSGASQSRYSLMEFMRDFPDDVACLEWLWRTRFSPDGSHAFCPKCRTETTFKRYETTQRRQSWTCTSCGHHLHPTAGTIFAKSATALHLWFCGIYLMTSTRCGISAKQLEREIGVTYKTAWRMFHLIRELLLADDDGSPLTGEVEVDETYVGGRPRLGQIKNKQDAGRWRDRKTKVFGMVERGGRVVARVVPDTEGPTLFSHIQARVLPEAVVF